MIFGGNWKANPVGSGAESSLDRGIQLIEGYAKNGLASLTDRELVVYVPDILIPGLSSYVKEKGYGFKLGAQNVSSHHEGAHTGQTPVQMIHYY